MIKKIQYISFIILFITIPTNVYSGSKDWTINLIGSELCPNSATSIVLKEFSKLNPEDTLTIIIERENKHLIISVIKLEKLPVIFEEKDEGNLTHLVIRLKR